MSNNNDKITISDGSLDWSEGVNSDVVTTIQSALNPNGLKRTQVSWMDNATTRGGGLIQRSGWNLQGALPGTGIYQGFFPYHPDNANPYLIFVRGGHVWKVDEDSPAGAVDLSEQFGLTMPLVERVWFCQAEMFLVIQAGDGTTLPLFWDGTIMRRSRGLLGSFPTNATYSVVLNNIDSVAGTTFPDQTALNSPLGVGYTGFTAPAIASPVTVTLDSAYAGNVGDVISFPINGSGQMQLISINPPGADWKYTYKNLSIPAGTAVPAQYAPSTTPGDGANFPAFTAPAINSTIVFHFPAALVNPGLVNVFTFVASVSHFSVTTINSGANSTQATVSEIPSATAMIYYLGRLWYAQDRQFSAGDIVRGTYGSQVYDFRDSVLKVTENPLAIGGDGFTVPTTAGNIRGFAYASNLNTALGQGILYVGTINEIYAITVPMTRSDWINATSSNGPTMTVALESNGWVNDRSIVAVNGDLFFQSLEPSIRSFTTSVRNFQQWGNVPISINENRILQFVDRALMHLSSGIYFDNRLLETTVPYQCPVGVAHKALAVLNFDVISTFERQLPPCWEGMWEGLNFLEICSLDFGGRERAFAAVWSDETSQIELWELTTDQRWDKNGENRVKWYIEFPAFTWGHEFELKKLIGGELWLDKLLGEVMFKMEYRPDGESCWYPWIEWKACTAKDSCESIHEPVCAYPASMRESYRQTVSLPVPPRACEAVMGRPSNIGYQFQTRLTILGWVRIRGLILHAEPVERKLYSSLVC